MAVDKIAGQKIPDWRGTDPQDLQEIMENNIINSTYETPEELKPVPGRCNKCRNPLSKCICRG